MKVHLRDSEEPLHEGEDIDALCGAQVKNAAFAFAMDEQMVGDLDEVLNSLTTCGKCLNAAGKIGGRYIYGLVNGEDAKQGERHR